MKFFLTFISLFILLNVRVAYADTLSMVQNVTYKETENGVKVLVNVKGNPNFNYFRLSDGRIVLDIDKAFVSKKGDIKMTSSIVEGIHFAQNTPDKVRVVIESDKNYPYIVSKVSDGLEVNVGNFKISKSDSNGNQISPTNNSSNLRNSITSFTGTQPEIVGNSGRNNPGNLRSAYGGFNSYKDLGSGIYAAYYNIIRKPGYYNGGNESIKKIIYTWAPPTENNSSRYLSDVIRYCRKYGLNINEDTIFSNLSLEQQEIVLSAIFNEEGNRDWINATKNFTDQQKIALINDSILQHSTSNYVASNTLEQNQSATTTTTEPEKPKESSQGIDKFLGKTIIGIIRTIF